MIVESLAFLLCLSISILADEVHDRSVEFAVQSAYDTNTCGEDNVLLGSKSTVSLLQQDGEIVVKPYQLANSEESQAKCSLPKGNPTARTAYIRILVMLEYDYYTKILDGNYTRALSYTAAFWNSVDAKFRMLGSVNVRLNIANLYIAQAKSSEASYLETFVQNNEELVNGSVVLDTLGPFAAETFPQNYDFVVLVTDKRQSADSDTCLGLSSFGDACDSFNAVVTIRDDGAFRGVSTAAHEMAHVLSVDHDGEGTSSACEWKENYIMGESELTASNLRWSECSERAIREFLEQGGSCLYQKKPDVGVPYPRLLPGQVKGRLEICKRAGYDDIEKETSCDLLFCKKSSVKGRAFSNGITPEGTPCGQNKICVDGQCADNPYHN